MALPARPVAPDLQASKAQSETPAPRAAPRLAWLAQPARPVNQARKEQLARMARKDPPV